MNISVIILSSIAGVFEFEKTTESVDNNAGVLEIKIVRKDGDNGTVTVKVHAVAGTAKPDQDYVLFYVPVEFADRQVYQIF